MENELKPCPFCGAKAEVKSAMGEYWVLCEFNCTGMESSQDRAIAAWNRRAPEGERDDRRV